MTGVLLTGGRSSRFGSDKALYEIDGVSMIKRTYAALKEVAYPVFISVATRDAAYPLPSRHIVDRFPHAGPLAGIHAAVSHAPTDWVLVLAVDLPYLTASDLQHLLNARTDTLDAVVATTRERMQPLAGCYHKRIEPVLRQCLIQDQRAVVPCIEQLAFKTVTLSEASLRNLNFPPQ